MLLIVVIMELVALQGFKSINYYYILQRKKIAFKAIFFFNKK